MDKLTYGWLSPDGEFVECDYADHYYYARNLCNELYKSQIDINLSRADDFLINNGWVKISRSLFNKDWYIICYKFTKAQYDILKPLIKNERIEPLSKCRFEDYEEENFIN